MLKDSVGCVHCQISFVTTPSKADYTRIHVLKYEVLSALRTMLANACPILRTQRAKVIKFPRNGGRNNGGIEPISSFE